MTPTLVLFEMQGQQVLVAEEAKSRGLRTVTLNHDPLRTSGPFAVRDGVIDEHIHVASWSDGDAVRRLVGEVERGNDIVGVHASFEPTQRYAIELRGRLGLPHNTVEDTLHVLDKGWVRRRLHAEGLSRLGHTTLPEALTWETWQFDGPAVLKPGNGTASVLCFIVRSLDELREAAATARAAKIPNPLMHEYVTAHGEFVLEELAQGELLSVESLVSRGKVQHVGLTGRYMLAADPVVEQGLFFPYEHPRAAEIIEVCARFHESLNVVEGATHIEVMVPDSGPIELIDFNLRFAGIGAIALASDAFGVPFARYLADLACGLEPDLSRLERRRYAVDVAVMPPAGVTEFRDLTFAPGTVRHRVNKKVGGPLSGRNDQIDSVAWFAVTGESAAEAHQNALSARAATVFNGAPLGDGPPLICARHLTAELTGS
ncbi:MAG: ATP-grasp domain-containing protein [Actinoallomurus sp.]